MLKDLLLVLLQLLSKRLQIPLCLKVCLQVLTLQIKLIEQFLFQKVLSFPSCHASSNIWEISHLQLTELFTFLNIMNPIQIIIGTKPFSSDMLNIWSLMVKVLLTEEASCGGSEILSKDNVSAADQLCWDLSYLDISRCMMSLSLTLHTTILSSEIPRRSICMISKSTLMSLVNCLSKNSSVQWFRNPLLNMVILLNNPCNNLVTYPLKHQSSLLTLMLSTHGQETSFSEDWRSQTSMMQLFQNQPTLVIKSPNVPKTSSLRTSNPLLPSVCL